MRQNEKSRVVVGLRPLPSAGSSRKGKGGQRQGEVGLAKAKIADDERLRGWEGPEGCLWLS